MDYKILKNIKSPEDIKHLSSDDIVLLCGEIRDCIIDTVSKNGGHLASNLGVVELTVALHRVFSAPDDAIIFDVGHQSYAHKLLTGRFEQFNTIRTAGGISGYMRPDESIYDPFVTGHSSNSVSAAYGIYKAKALTSQKGTAIAVIGDGAMTGGMAFEALNNAGTDNGNFIVILNDNKMSISKNVGAMARSFSKLRNHTKYHNFKFALNKLLFKIPYIGKPIYNALYSFKEYIKKIVYRNNIFVNLGFNYLGPVDGHNEILLENVMRIANSYNRPTLIHVVTKKGKGYSFAENKPYKYHGVSPFNIECGADNTAKSDFSSVAGKALCTLAASNNKICAITAAMTSGIGLIEFSKRFKNRFFDVGIAEQHAVTFGAGLAKGGVIPFFAVYSSFLQRGYDQVLHDAAIAHLPLKLLVDRAGVVGEDGESHQGVFDAAYLSTIPGMVIYSPSTYAELRSQIYKTAGNDELCAIRYPRGCCKENPEEDFTGDYTVNGDKNDRLIITYGRIYFNVLKAQKSLKNVDVIKLNKIFPIANDLIDKLGKYKEIHFFEEGIKSGGIGEHLGNMLSESGFSGKYSVHAIDGKFVPCADVPTALKNLGFDTDSIINTLG